MKKRSHNNHNPTEGLDCYPCSSNSSSMHTYNNDDNEDDDNNNISNDNERISQLPTTSLSLSSFLQQQIFYKDRNIVKHTTTTTTAATIHRHRRTTIFLTMIGGISIVCCYLVGAITIVLHLITAAGGGGGGGGGKSSSIYKGTPWFNNERTISVQTISETKFARCDIHTVKSEKQQSPQKSGDGVDDSSNIITDWLFLEELDAVNIAVMMMTDDNDNDTSDSNLIFPVFEQNKYAIPGITLSPVGGMIDHDNESPWECAKREVFEELGVGSRRTKQQIDDVIKKSLPSSSSVSNDNETIIMKAFTLIPKQKRTVDEYSLAMGGIDDNNDQDDDEDEDWIFLGRYRSAANRGAGFAYTYLLKNAVPLLNNGGTPEFKLSTGDDEYQKIKLLSKTEIQSAVIAGKFQEVKWTTTYALSLLHLDSTQQQKKVKQ